MEPRPSRFHALDRAPYALPPEVATRFLSPSLLIFLDLVRENVQRVLAHCGGRPERWRPHVKTSKIPAVWAELARAGLRRFKTATTRETAVLLDVLEQEGAQGADLLLAYPLLGPGLERLGAIAAAHPGAEVSVLCEDRSRLAEIPPAVSVFVDINPGMDRTGVPQDDLESILAIAQEAGPRFRGLHYYDGHLHGGDLGERRRRAHAGYERLLELAAALRRAGLPPGELITSGTHSFMHALAFEPFDGLGDCAHTVSPGTVVYNDVTTEQGNPDLELAPAALVMARVVSHPARNIATCDAGSKSLAAEAGDPCALVLGHPELVAGDPNEEHLPLLTTSGERPARGEALLLVPRHVCPTTNLAEEAVLIEGGQVVGIAQVSARAHELLPSSPNANRGLEPSTHRKGAASR